MFDFMMVEEALGYWYYHIAYRDRYTKPICGSDMVTMQTSIPMSTWGYVGHLKEKYCDECKAIYDKEKDNENNR